MAPQFEEFLDIDVLHWRDPGIEIGNEELTTGSPSHGLTATLSL